jgi:urease accessory protein
MTAPDGSDGNDVIVPGFVRASGELRASFERVRHRTLPARVYEQGGLRIRFPASAGDCEAVLINTGGGIAGGDAASLSFAAGEGARVVLTTQSAEKVYRSQGSEARVSVNLTLDEGADLAWLPQETILFDRARLSRQLDIQLAPSASLTILESVVFGRLAMGEHDTHGSFRDRWRIRRGERLIFADAVRLGPEIGRRLDRPAGGGGARMIATLIHVAPDAETKLADVRAGIGAASGEMGRPAPPNMARAGASAWNGMLLARLVAADPPTLRTDLARLLSRLGCESLPRVWQ